MRHERGWSHAVAIFTAIGLLASAVSPVESFGELLARDLRSPGDALVTLDTETRLAWLDLTETTNHSWNDIVSGEGGWYPAGWRHATTAEVCSLFSRHAFPVVPCPGETLGLVEQILPLQGLFGVTSTPNLPWSIGFFDDGTGGEFSSVGIAYLWLTLGGNGGAHVREDANHPFTPSVDFGHWLVSTPGTTQANPLLPPESCDECPTAQARQSCEACRSRAWPCFWLCNVPTQTWSDPPVATGFEYEIDSSAGALFTSIDAFPAGFAGPFTVSVSGVDIPGSFGPGDSVHFGAGVTRFRISGIDPAVDSGRSDAFPVKLSFNTPTASFAMTPLVTCGETPASNCQPSQRGSLVVDERKAGKEQLVAQIKKGPDQSLEDLGSPLLSDGTAYSLCIYDDQDALVEALHVDRAGEFCGRRSCWKQAGLRYGFKDPDLESDGVAVLTLRSGNRGAASSVLKARNDAAKGRTSLPTGIAARLDSSEGRVTLQLVGNDAQACFSVTLDDVRQHEASYFQARR